MHRRVARRRRPRRCDARMTSHVWVDSVLVHDSGLFFDQRIPSKKYIRARYIVAHDGAPFHKSRDDLIETLNHAELHPAGELEHGMDCEISK